MTDGTRWARGRLAVPAAALALLAVCVQAGASAAARVPAAQPERYPVPPSGTFTLHGRGFGHGHGMSQWGAYGAARVGHLSTNQILHFYYPHTTLATVSAQQPIRVLLSALNVPGAGHVDFRPAPGLSAAPDTGDAASLPATTSDGQPVDLWRLDSKAGALRLRGHWQDRWHTVARNLGASVTVTDTAERLAVAAPTGSATLRYRGTIDVEFQSGGVQAVNTLPVEAYLRSVVPGEMPAAWPAAALRSQAVAARTYAWRGIAHPKTSWFDVFGDTRDQAYAGMGAESHRTNRAIRATSGEVIVDPTGEPVLAQYAAADGGWTVSGGTPYLPAHHDPYDGAVPNDAHSWTTPLTAAAIASAYPSVGAVKRLLVTARDGHGAWGGRVTAITIVGTKAKTSVSGTAFQTAVGLRSPWFRPTPTPGPPLGVDAASRGNDVTVTWKAPAAVQGAADINGYRVRLMPGGAKARVDPQTLTATFDDLAPGSYTATVAARSAAGRGRGASASVTVGGK